MWFLSVPSPEIRVACGGGGGGGAPDTIRFPLSQITSYGDLDKHGPKRSNSSPRMPHLVMAVDETLTLPSELEQPEGLLPPLAPPLRPLEVQGLIRGPRFPSLPEHLDSVPKQLEFQRHGSDPGFVGS